LRPHGEEVHSAYIGTTAELGFPGLLLFLAILVSTARYLRRVAREAREDGAETIARISSALVLSLLGWAIASLFLSSETSRPVWIVIGLALALGKLLETHRREAVAG
jgi:O-antigen ligase